MSDKSKGQQADNEAKPRKVPSAKMKTVKVTLHLAVETAQRLGIESAMRRISQSTIAEEVLATYLSRWQLPEATDPDRRSAG
jgi:hypothetical protein